MTAGSTNPKQWNVGLVGYGEVGRILAEDLRAQDVKVIAYDIKLGGSKAAILILPPALAGTHHGRALKVESSPLWKRISPSSDPSF